MRQLGQDLLEASQLGEESHNEDPPGSPEIQEQGNTVHTHTTQCSRRPCGAGMNERALGLESARLS